MFALAQIRGGFILNTGTLIKKNIKWNFKNYFLYFASMIFIIMIVYTFNSIQYNNQIIENVNKNMIILMKVGAVCIYIFAFIFMWYSNSFFTRNRKKEVGLYSMLGVEKRKIARMLFVENFMLGALALFIGILLGTLLSRIFVMLLFNLMGKFVAVKFTLSITAITTTATIFGIFFVILSIHSYVLIYRFKLIEFFRAKSKREKQPKGSALIGISSLIMLITGYIIAIGDLKTINFPIYVLLVLSLVIIGTYGVFSSFMVFYGKMKRRNTKKLYRGMNLINTSNFIYRIRSNSFILGSIAILSATAITAAGMSYSFYYQIGVDMEASNPYSYSYALANDKIDSKITNIIEKYPEHKIILDKTIDVKYSECNILDRPEKSYNFDATIISESQFAKIAEFNGLSKIDLEKNDTIAFVSPTLVDILEKDNSVKLINSDKKFKVKDLKVQNIAGVSVSTFTLVVDDEVYSQIKSEREISQIRFIEVENKRESTKLTKELEELFSNERDTSYYTRLDAFETIYTAQMEFRGMFMFVGIFIALVVLVCTGSMIYFKLINEAEDEKMRYEIVRKVGASKKDIFKSIGCQMAIMFAFPIVIGITHAAFALGALSQLLGKNLVIPTIITMIAYVLIYCIYYLLTISKYNHTVNK